MANATFESFQTELSRLVESFGNRLTESPSSKVRRKTAGPRCRAAQISRSSPRDERNNEAAQQHRPTKSNLRREFRAWRLSLPTQLERDTLLWPEIMAEGVVAEASRYLNAEIPADYPARLAAKAHYLYPRHKHFHKGLNRPGNRGRATLRMFMRHWTAGWLKRERYSLFKRLPWSYAHGSPLPAAR